MYFLMGGPNLDVLRCLWHPLDDRRCRPGLMTPTPIWVSDAQLRAILGRVLAYPTGEHWSGDTSDRRDLRQAGRLSRNRCLVERLEMILHPWVGFAVMPIFALANTDVPITGDDLGQTVSGLLCRSCQPIGGMRR